MKSKEIRKTFLNYFKEKNHLIVNSAPMVLKDDPSLMFTNAGMNQFKDIFLGNKDPENTRVADTQKCLRVSGKHNDLEEVGRDSYHHTMFEMLGNWSFGDYFKEDAIKYAWDLLTNVYGLEDDRLYATVFEGNKEDNLKPDEEAKSLWSDFLPEERILWGNKKDNFWEMGETGPCGPCSELHIDLRSEEERADVEGSVLVNQDHPLVIEIWNLVFIQYNRLTDGTLELLSSQHVDTGMGFERLTMAIQNKKSNYDTDIFEPFIRFLEEESGKSYNGSYEKDADVDIAFRVIADHIRATSFAIADGALPSNTGPGYVIRRILRRAVRFYYSFLEIEQAVIYKLVPLMVEQFGEVFPEIREQSDFITRILKTEEETFLKTLEEGLQRIDNLDLEEGEEIDGRTVFMLYDTYGFPPDLTQLIAEERRWNVDEDEFDKYMMQQKERSREAGKRSEGDWIHLKDSKSSEFLGYESTEIKDADILSYRKLKEKGEEYFQLVLGQTPFYPEGGGQVGDTGFIISGYEKIRVLDTVRENDLIIHITQEIPTDLDIPVTLKIDKNRRRRIENNHSATHLVHAALREVLGDHVEQRGSLVAEEYLRFDFSHFEKMTTEEINRVEDLVNEKIRQNISRKEENNVPIETAREEGARMLFGEKYGDTVRVITFDDDYSKELCGGCHVDATGKLGTFKIISESSVASGVRRIEAKTAEAAERYLRNELVKLNEIRQLFKNPTGIVTQVEKIIEKNNSLQKELESFKQSQVADMKDSLLDNLEERSNYNLLTAELDLEDGSQLKDLAFQLLDKTDRTVLILGANINGKAQITIATQKGLESELNIHAGNLIKKAAPYIKGGGGGQPFFASAGGADASGLKQAIEEIKAHLPS